MVNVVAISVYVKLDGLDRLVVVLIVLAIVIMEKIRLCALAEANVNAISVFAIVSMLESFATRVMGVKKDVHISRTVSAAKFIKLGHLLIVVIAGAMRRLKALIMWSHTKIRA